MSDEQDRSEPNAPNRGAIRLLDEWMADESGYDEETFPALKRGMNENRRRTEERVPFPDLEDEDGGARTSSPTTPPQPGPGPSAAYASPEGVPEGYFLTPATRDLLMIVFERGSQEDQRRLRPPGDYLFALNPDLQEHDERHGEALEELNDLVMEISKRDYA